MITTGAYMAAVSQGAQITPLALVVTLIVDMVWAKAFTDAIQARYAAKQDYVPVAVISQPEVVPGDEQIEDMALDAEEVKERYGQ